jgi:zinc transporter ZupT
MDQTTSNAFLDELMKIAAADVDAATDYQSAVTPDKQTPPMYRQHPALDVAAGLGGFALGAGIGYGGAHLANRGIQALGGEPLSPSTVGVIAPVAGLASGIGFSYLQHKIMQRLHEHAEKGPTRDEQHPTDTGF